jgi:hypothetical protein
VAYLKLLPRHSPERDMGGLRKDSRRFPCRESNWLPSECKRQFITVIVNLNWKRCDIACNPGDFWKESVKPRKPSGHPVNLPKHKPGASRKRGRKLPARGKVTRVYPKVFGLSQ